MPRQEPGRRSDCPVAYALDVVGDRWTLLIVRDLLFNAERRFGDLLDSEEGIATNILADRLSKLEARGIVTAQRDPENRRSKRYRITEVGRALAPVIIEMMIWSAEHDPQTAATKAWLRRAKKDKDALRVEMFGE